MSFGFNYLKKKKKKTQAHQTRCFIDAGYFYVTGFQTEIIARVGIINTFLEPLGGTRHSL